MRAPPKRTAASTRADYVARVNRVLDYVAANLDGRLDLATLARVARFSPFHFHRVFVAVVGETLRDHVARVRVERAATLLQRAGPALPITEVAQRAGFDGPSQLSRRFREEFGVTPSAFRRGATPIRKNRQDDGRRRPYPSDALELRQNPDRFRVAVERLEPFTAAYVRVVDSFREANMVAGVAKLEAWAKARSLEKGVRLGMSQDDPTVTPLALCRYDFGVVVPAGTRGEGEVGVRAVDVGLAATLDVVGDMPKTARAWDYLFAVWLPSSGYLPANQPAIEFFKSAPTSEGVFDLRCVLPVVRARTSSRRATTARRGAQR